MWWVEIGALVAGGLVGWVTSWWFERRALVAARDENAELEAELERLCTELGQMRSVVLSLGGTPSVDTRRSPNGADLSGQVLTRARAMQDAAGRVAVSHLTAQFLALGHHGPAVSAAVDDLVSAGSVRRDADHLVVL